MSVEPHRLDSNAPQRDAVLPRLYLRDPAWRIAVKQDSQREFCYTINPGEDFYHRLSAGEIHLTRGEEKICLRCADRFGILEVAPRPLRDPVAPPRLEATEAAPFELSPNPPGSPLA